MKSVFTVLMIAFLATSCNSDKTKSSGTSAEYNFDTTLVKAGGKFYQCEMHPEIISAKPGSCPKCSMDLVERLKK